jgi:hypothetical protein
VNWTCREKEDSALSALACFAPFYHQHLDKVKVGLRRSSLIDIFHDFSVPD